MMPANPAAAYISCRGQQVFRSKRYTSIISGLVLLAAGIGLAYLTGSMGFDWGRPIWHGLALIISIFGLYFIWYGIHWGYYDRLVKKVKTQLEEDTNEFDI